MFPSLTAKYTPLMIPAEQALFRILLKISHTKLNSKGDIGSPCLSPLSGVNFLVGEPFTSINILKD